MIHETKNYIDFVQANKYFSTLDFRAIRSFWGFHIYKKKSFTCENYSPFKMLTYSKCFNNRVKIMHTKAIATVIWLEFVYFIQCAWSICSTSIGKRETLYRNNKESKFKITTKAIACNCVKYFEQNTIQDISFIFHVWITRPNFVHRV